MRLKIILGSVLVVAVIVVGCGGGGDTSGGTSAGGTAATTTAGSTDGDSGGSSKPLTKKEFITKGDAVCEKVPNEYGEKLAALEKENPKATTEEKALKAAVPPLYPAAEELAELTPPKGDEQIAEEIVEALEAAAKGLEEKPNSELVGAKSPFAEFQELTSKYGFKGCTQL